MHGFYRRLGEGAPVDEALRGAQLEMIRGGSHGARPVSWAGFVLSGDASHAVLTPRRRLTPLLVALPLAALALFAVRRRPARLSGPGAAG